MKNRTVIDNTHHFAKNAERKRQRDEEHARKRSLELSVQIYNDWQAHVVIQSRKIDELPGLLNDLANRLEAVPHEDLRKNILNIVHQKLGDVFTRIEMEKNIVRVLADCPHKIPAQAPFTTEERDCGWGGEIAYHKTIWEAGGIKFTCPQCRKELTENDMILATTKVAEKSNRIIRYRPCYDRGVKLRPNDIYRFTGVKQLLEFPFVKEWAGRKGFKRFAIDERFMVAVFEGMKQDRIEKVGLIEHPKAVDLPALHANAAAPPAPNTPAAESPAANSPGAETPTAETN